MHALRIRLAGACLGAAAVLVLAASPAPAVTAGIQPVAAVTGPVPGSPGPGIGLTTVGLQGWRVQSSATATQTGDRISTPGFDTAGWLGVTPDDAGAPGTEVEALLQNGICPHDPTFPVNQGSSMSSHNVFFSDNLQHCFGLETAVGPDTIPEFSVPWWFRTDFRPNLGPGQHARLVVNGVVGQADVWVDGTEVGTQATVQGAYASHTFDITDLVRPGTNSLALEVYPNNPNAMLTLDTVDWNQIAPDNNTGIQFPIQLHVSGTASIADAHVMQNDAPDLSSAALTVRADVSNDTAAPRTETVTAAITPPGGGAPIQVSRPVTLPAGATRTVTFTPSANPQLDLQHPQVWWPYQMGAQPLYGLRVAVSDPGGVSDATPATTFGIRTVTTSLTAPSSLARDGVRVFAINGRPFVFRGGGWAENLFLHYSARDLANQISIIRSLGLNGVRTEGKELPADFYEQMDRAGLLIDAGFQCCDYWAPNGDGTGVQAPDYQVMEQSSLTIGRRLRSHPSVLDFSWSDNAPIPEQEVASLQGFAQAGFQEPIVSSAESNRSGLLGPAGEKEGPYDWVPPDYWYDTTHASHNATDNDPTMTNVGGSWGFDSEQSAGDTVATPDSLQRFLSASDLAALWQQPDAHQYHTNYESPAGEHVGYSFGTLANLDQAVTSRYGAWSSLAQYVEEAQVQNYEDTRAQFEAFLDHWNNSPTPSTGTVYWQLNKGWPTLLWALYNSDYDLAGSYFGAKKANERLHVLYAYDNGTVAMDNLTGVAQPDVSVESRVHGLDGRVLDDQVARGLTLTSQDVRSAVLTPRVPAATTPPAAAQTYWVELILRQRGSIVDRNVYWLSTQQDVVDWNDTQGNPQALTSPTTAGLPQYANLQALQGLPRAGVTAVASSGTGEGRTTTSVTITNPSTATGVAFFLRADVRRGTPGGRALGGDDQVLPITWSDNDVTLWPGQSETLTATYDSSLLAGAAPVVGVSGWNVPGLVVAAPATPDAAAAQRAAAAGSGLEHFGGADGTPLVSGSAAPGPGTSAQPGTTAPAGPRVAWTIRSAAASPAAPAGTFAQGDGADTYTLTVTNSGGAATDGTTPVTLTDVVDPDLGLTSISGAGWTCDTSNNPTVTCAETGGPGGAPAILRPGQSYPPLTLTVGVTALAGYGSQDSTAGLHVTNAVSVAGGAPSQPAAAIAPQTPIVGAANLTVDDAIATAFRQGDAGDSYQITVINQGAGATNGRTDSPIVATVAVPTGETAVSLSGSGWTCNLTPITTPYVEPADTCYRTGVLQGENGEAPPITLVVAVSTTAPASVTQSVTVSGGGELASPATVGAVTTVLPAAAGPPPPGGSLTVTSAHTGGFAQGGTDSYALTVRNAAAGPPTHGTVTVTDTLPPGLTATRMTGQGWTCSLQPAALPGTPNTFEPLDTCSRSDSLAAGAAYPPITLTVTVADGALPSVTNTATVTGGGPTPASASATDVTAIAQRADLGVTALESAGGVPYAPFARGDGPSRDDTYTIAVANAGFASTSGPVTLAVDLPAGLTALSMSGSAGWSCDASTTTCATRPGVALRAGAQASITLRVAVSADAPSSLVTWLRVSGGGEIEPADDTSAVYTYVTDRPSSR